MKHYRRDTAARILFHPITGGTGAGFQSIYADYLPGHAFCKYGLTLLDKLGVKGTVTITGCRNGYLANRCLNLLSHLTVATIGGLMGLLTQVSVHFTFQSRIDDIL